MSDNRANDTTGDAFSTQVGVLRRLDIGSRAAMAFELSDNLRHIVADGVRHRHPEWSTQRVRRAVLRMTLGQRVYDRTFGEVDGPDD